MELAPSETANCKVTYIVGQAITANLCGLWGKTAGRLLSYDCNLTYKVLLTTNDQESLVSYSLFIMFKQRKWSSDTEPSPGPIKKVSESVLHAVYEDISQK